MTVATISVSPSEADGPDGAMAVTEKPSGSAPSCLCPQCGFTVELPASHLAISTLTSTSTSTSTPASSDAEALLQQAREQINALQAQVSHLDQKAASAIDRWADYEDELAQLRRQLAAVNETGGTRPQSRAAPVTPASPTRTSFLPTGAANRLSALLSLRSAKSTSNLKETAAQQYSRVPTGMPTPPPSKSNGSSNNNSSSSNTTTNNITNNNNYDCIQATVPACSVTPVTTPQPPRTPYGSFSFFGGKIPTPPPHQQLQQLQQQPRPMSPSTKELMDALTREKKLRRAAEGRLNDTSREVEELSVSLFEQANEMVAEERRARARLEARVAVLEQRDTNKKARLERLELAMARIGRLRAMLGDDAGAHVSADLAIEQHETSMRKPSLTAVA